MEISKKVYYERLKNGIDVHVLKTSAKDIIFSKIAICGGRHAANNNPVLTQMLDELLPGGTKKKKKNDVLDKFEKLGAQVGVTFTSDHMVISLYARSGNFLLALSLLVETIIQPSFSKQEFDVALKKVDSMLIQMREHAEYQASVALSQSLFKKEHPHWVPGNSALSESLQHITLRDVTSFYRNTLSSVGGAIVVVGDIKGKDFYKKLAKILENIPQKKVEHTLLHPDKILKTERVDTVVPLKGKLNVDMFLGAPLMITADASDYTEFLFGVKILGMSSTSRLFNTMRTKENLTYGAVAQVVGAEGGYPPYLKCWTILPNNVFQKGRNIMKHVVKDFIEMGVTTREVRNKKEEILGKTLLRLSTTKGLCEEMFNVVMLGKSFSEIDTISDRIESMTTKKINTAIQAHIDFALVKTAAAGAVRADGTPIK